MLPNLSSMESNGVKSKLISTMLPLSPPAWTTFLTGKNPGSHGVYDFAKRVEGSYNFRPTSSLDRRHRAIWEVVGENGGKSIIVNVPLTYPPSPIKGAMITGFPTPTEKGDYTYPPNLMKDLEAKLGPLKIHKPKVLYRKGREQEITNETIQITKDQTRLVGHLMDTTDWDLAVTVFDATDVLGHYFWAYLDPNHPKFDPKLAGPVRAMVDEIHVELDKAIGALLQKTKAEDLKVVMSDHGFGPVYYGVYINNWLVGENYLKFKRKASVRAKHYLFRHGLNVYNLLRVARRLRLVSSIESAYSSRSFALRALNLISLNLEDIDWSRTKVYSFGNMGQLYLNKKGREPQGTVSQEEADPLIKELVSKVSGMKDPRTGKLMFDAVFPGADVFRGPEKDSGADVVFLDQSMIYAAHRMFELGSSSLVTPHPVYSGNHKMDGILFVNGEGVKRGSMDSRMPGVVDLAPTILDYLGLPLQGDEDGRVLEDLYSSYSRSVRADLPKEVEQAKITNSVVRLGREKKL
jgi:predicted AlkP superfamily phosphohydrolase/phosphomutase